MAGDRPSGTVTFLFTDIEGSTRLWDEHPAEMQTALARHDAIVRDAIVTQNGYIFATGGDGFAAAFGTADEAIAAALHAQRRLADETFEGGIDVRVRMGLHTGAADERDGDYFGQEPTRAARVMTAAWGGQVLASRPVIDLSSGEVEFLDLGEHRLRDLSTVVHLYELQVAEHRRGFPPIRTLQSRPTNLPALPTSFVGREAELDELRSLAAEANVLTLTGVGGVGKTRLALQLGAAMLPDVDGGVWLVELAPLGDESLVIETIAGDLGMPNEGVGAADWLRQRLAGTRTLIVLDNCEHLLDGAAGAVEDVLAMSGAVRFIVTSREPLGVAGEQVRPVRSLPSDSTAVDLFYDRANAIRPDFDPEREARGDVAELCRHLDGIPLAIELAAARVRAMSPAELLDRLDQRFRLLSGGGRRVKRHQAMRAAIDWSYDLLDDAEQLALRRASVFAGSFDISAAAAVIGSDAFDDVETLELLAALADKSLIQVSDHGGSSRYSMLETIREYGLDALIEAEEADAAREAHAGWFATLVRRAGGLLTGSDPTAGVDLLMADIDNLRAAMQWAASRPEPSVAASLVAPLAPACFAIPASLTALAEAALETPGIEAADETLAVRAVATYDAFNRRSDLEQAQALANEIVDQADASPLALRLAGSAYLTSEHAEADFIERAISKARELGDDYELGQTMLMKIALDQAASETMTESIELASEAWAIAQRVDNPHARCSAAIQLGWSLMASSPEEALEHLDHAASFDEQVASAPVGMAMCSAGRLLADQGRHDEGLRRCRDGVEILTNRQHVAMLTGALTDVALAVLAAGDHEQALELTRLARAANEGVVSQPRYGASIARVEQAVGVGPQPPATIDDPVGEARALVEGLAATTVRGGSSRSGPGVDA